MPVSAPPQSLNARSQMKRPKKDVAELLNDCNQRLRSNPADVTALLTRASIYLRKGKSNCMNPLDIRHVHALRLFKHFFTTDLLPEALAEYAAVLKLNPQCIDALFYTGSIYEKQNMLDLAIETFSRVLKLEPGNARAAMSRAHVHNMKGNIVQAIDDYTLALQNDNNVAAGTAKFGQRRMLLQQLDVTTASASVASSEVEGSCSSPSESSHVSLPNHVHDPDEQPSITAHISSHDRDATNKLTDLKIPDHANNQGLGGMHTPAESLPYSHITSDRGAVQSSNPDGQYNNNTMSMYTAASRGGTNHTSTAPQSITAHGLTADGGRRGATETYVPLEHSSYHGIGGPKELVGDVAEAHSLMRQGGSREQPDAVQQASTSGSTGATSDTSRRAQAIADHHARGYVLRRQGNYQAAAEEYSKGLTLDAHHFKTYFNRGFTYDKLGDYQLAIADYTRAIDIEPGNSFAYYNRGITKERLGDLSGAVADFSMAIDLDPKSADNYHNRGYAYRRAGMLEAAVADYNQAILINPHHSRAYYNRGFCHDGLGKVEEALQDYTRSIELEPVNVTAYHGRGSLYQRLGRQSEALDDFNAALGSDPSCAVTRNARGVLLKSLGYLNEAMSDFDAAVELAPSSAPFFRNRAQCRRALNDLHGCIADFTRAIQLDATDVASHVQRGHSFRRIGEYEAAIKDYTLAMQLSEDKTFLYNHRAYCYAKIGCFTESVIDYNHALELDPGNAHALYNRWIGYAKTRGSLDP